jgi:SAM-dependent methyltransferase
MKLNEQRDWYEGWHGADRADLPVESLKQQMRLDAIRLALDTVRPHSILVVGCGRGDELALLKAEQVTAFDLSVKAAYQARSFLPDYGYLQADGMQLPFARASFDFALSSEVIEHMLQPEAMLTEIQRVLKPGGYVLLTTPNWNSFFGLARWLGEKILRRPVTSDDQPVDHWSTSDSLRRILNEAGFKVVARYGAWYFPPTGLGRKRLPDKPMASLFRTLLPVERRLQTSLPGLGHMLVVLAQRL